jgi:hypothetical protein
MTTKRRERFRKRQERTKIRDCKEIEDHEEE